MRRFALVLAAAVASPAMAADLAIAPPPAPPVVVLERPDNFCITGGPARVFRAPMDEFSGFLPAGMLVEVIDAPWSQMTDLWIRVRPVRAGNYYGWVETRDFVCF